MVSMWLKALRVIPRITNEEWNTLDIISKWLIASRGAVFIMTAIAAAIGGLLASRYGHFRWDIFLCSLIGLVLAHATNNMLNDYVDFNKGIDKDNYFRAQYGPHPLEHGLLSKKVFIRYILVTLMLSLLSGFYIYTQIGTPALWLIGIGLFFLLFYTWPLKYFGLGELAVILVWGPLMIGGTYFVTSQADWNGWVVIISLVYGIGPTTVLLGKHTDKLLEDKAKGVHTLPVIIGQKASRYTVIALMVLEYLFTALLVIVGQLGPALLLVFLSVPTLLKTIKLYAQPRPLQAPKGEEGIWPLYLVSYAFEFNRKFGLLFLLGLIIDLILHKM